MRLWSRWSESLYNDVLLPSSQSNHDLYNFAVPISSLSTAFILYVQYKDHCLLRWSDGQEVFPFHVPKEQ